MSDNPIGVADIMLWVNPELFTNLDSTLRFSRPIIEMLDLV